MKSLYDNASSYSKSRWIALFDGINMISDVAESKSVDFNKINIKHPILNKYVDEVGDIFLSYMGESSNG